MCASSEGSVKTAQMRSIVKYFKKELTVDVHIACLFM